MVMMICFGVFRHKRPDSFQVSFHGVDFDVDQHHLSHVLFLRTKISEGKNATILIPTKESLKGMDVEIKDNYMIVSIDLKSIDYKSSWLENLSYFDSPSPEFCQVPSLKFQSTVLFYPEQRILYDGKVVLYYSNNYPSVMPRVCKIISQEDTLVVYYSVSF